MPERPEPSTSATAALLVPELLELGAATIGESGGRPMRARIRAVWRGARLAAPAFPVRCTPGDNLAIHVAVASAPPGSALAVDVGAEGRVIGLRCQLNPDKLAHLGKVGDLNALFRGE